MEKNSDILNKIAGRSGMTVPEGFFEDFARQMTAKLPEKQVERTNVLPLSMWQRVRPYVYMAAMFGGIWCMIKMFNLMGITGADMSIENNPTLASAISNEQFIEEYTPIESIDEYGMLQELYDSGMNTDEAFGLSD